MEGLPFPGRQVVPFIIHHEVENRAFRQHRGLIQDQPSVLHSCLHGHGSSLPDRSASAEIDLRRRPNHPADTIPAIVRPLHTFSDPLGRLLGGVLIALLGFLVLLATAETVVWAAFDLSWAASVEIQELLMVWFALLSGAWAVKEKLHLAVDLLVQRLPPPLRTAVARFAPAMVALLSLIHI